MTILHDLNKKEIKVKRRSEDEKLRIEYDRKLAELKRTAIENEMIDEELKTCEIDSSKSIMHSSVKGSLTSERIDGLLNSDSNK